MTDRGETTATRTDALWSALRFTWLLLKLVLPPFSLLHMAFDVLRAIQAFCVSMGLTATRVVRLGLLCVAGVIALKVGGPAVVGGALFVATIVAGGALLARDDLRALWIERHGAVVEADAPIDLAARRRHRRAAADHARRAE